MKSITSALLLLVALFGASALQAQPYPLTASHYGSYQQLGLSLRSSIAQGITPDNGPANFQVGYTFGVDKALNAVYHLGIDDTGSAYLGPLFEPAVDYPLTTANIATYRLITTTQGAYIYTFAKYPTSVNRFSFLEGYYQGIVDTLKASIPIITP